MRIILAKLTAMTLVVAAASASVVSLEQPAMPALRGPIALGDASSGIAKSDQAESPASDVTAKSDDEDKSEISDVSKSENSDASKSESLSSDDADDALFPDEMDEEERRNRNNRNNDDDRSQKKNASQKRQDQRDQRRSRNNPNRSQKEEQRERERKSRQASERGDRCQDPSEPGCGNDNYPRNRDAKRRYRCDTRGESCNYGRVNPRDEPNRRRADRDMDCIDYCRSNRSGRGNRGSSRARECTNRNCDGNKWKNGAATLGEWLLTQE